MRFEGTFFRRGMIMEWSGSVATVPAGWVLCDGNNSTPDLRNTFIVGAGDTYNPDATGGAAMHTHAFTSNLHSHVDAGPPGPFAAGLDLRVGVIAVTGTTDSDNNLPPFYALCYIMKI